MTDLSIIILQTNSENHQIFDTIKSIESQTFTDYEIILPNTPSLSTYYKTNDSKIKDKIIQTNTKKVSENLKIAKGKYILLLNEKYHILSENTLEKFINTIKENKLNALQSKIENSNNNPIILNNLLNNTIYNKEFLKNIDNNLNFDTPFLNLYITTNILTNLNNYKTIDEYLTKNQEEEITFNNTKEIKDFLKSMKYALSNLSSMTQDTYLYDFSKNIPKINYNHIPMISKKELKEIEMEIQELLQISNKNNKTIKYYITKYFRTLYDLLYNYNTKFDPLISIIIPTYNVEKYIDDCLTSLLNQSLKNIEIICVDDQSTDSTTEIIKYYQQKDKRVKFYQLNENKGSGGCRNYALTKAKGKYIQFVDGDDFLDLNTLKELYKLAEKEKTQILMFKATSYIQDEKFIIEPYYEMKLLKKYQNIMFGITDLENKLLFKTVFSPWNKLYLKSFLTSLNAKFPEKLIHQDNPFFFETFLNADRIYFIEKYYYNRRRRNGSITTLQNHVEIGTIEIIEHILNVFLKYGVYEEYKEPLLNKLLNKFRHRYLIIQKEYKEEFYKKSKNKLEKFTTQYGLKHDLNTYLNQLNKKVYNKFITTKNHEEFSQFMNKHPLPQKNENNTNIHLTEKNLNYNNNNQKGKFDENERKITQLCNLPRKPSSYLITIIIPVYNVEKYIEKCFLSIQKQTIGFKNLEIIFIDDCSTDNSFEIIKKYALNYSNVRIFQTDENSGAAGKPRNIGMKYASSKYLMFLDSDDEYYENACEVLYNKITETKSSLVSGMHTIFNKTINKDEIPLYLYLDTFTDNNLNRNERIENLKKFNQKYPKEITVNKIQEIPYIIQNYNIASKIFDLNFLQNNNIIFPEYIVAQDSVFLYKSLVSAEKFVFINEAIYKYNRFRDKEGDKSIMFNNNINLQITRLIAYNLIYEFSQEKKLEDITLKYIIRNKMNFFFKTYVLNNNLSEDDLINIFNKSKKLCELLNQTDAKFDDNLKELFSKIANNQYKEAIKLC